MTAKSRQAVLVIDDDAAVQRVARRVLERERYTVLLASSGEEGVALHSAHAADVVCAVVDLSMPGMSGWETIAALRAVDRTLPVVLASGYLETPADGAGDSSPGPLAGPAPAGTPPVAFIQKPFGVEELVRAVRSVASGA